MEKNRASKSECVKVVVRCRPFNHQERRDARRSVVEVDTEARQIRVQNPKADTSEPPKAFTFDQVYGESSTQQEIYLSAAQPIVEAVLNGYNGTIFAYGQTGCGKTYTMEGVPGDEGIIPTAFAHIFDAIAKGGAREYLVRASYLEIYNEEIRDLLGKNPQQRLELKESPDKGVYVKGLMQFVVRSVQEVASVLQVGGKNRSVGATLMNQDSSRSHSLFSLTVEASEAAAGGHIRVGKLNLVDLAGSERQGKTGASGARLREATQINLSLSALGNVISALVDGRSGHIPYRDSKLTRLLQDSLGGNTKTVMVATIGPADYNAEETLSTLRYANRAKRIANAPRINEDPKDAMLRTFHDEILRLKAALEAKTTAPPEPRLAPQAVDREGALGAIREALRAEVVAGLQAAVGREAMQAAQREAEERARAQLEAVLAESAAGEEEQRRAHEELDRQRGELAAYGEAIAAERAEVAALEGQLAALEGKVLHGGENLLEVVDALEAAAAEQAAAAEAQRQQQEAAAARLAALEEAHASIGAKYSSIQEEIEGKTQQLRRLSGALSERRAEAADLRHQFQREREALLEDLRTITQQIKLRDLVIASYIPPEHQELIMKHTAWDEYEEEWHIQHLPWAGNAVAARQAALAGPAPPAAPPAPTRPGGAGSVYLSYKMLKEEWGNQPTKRANRASQGSRMGSHRPSLGSAGSKRPSLGSAGSRRPPSAQLRLTDSGSRPMSKDGATPLPPGSPLQGAPQARPSREHFPAARGLVSASGRRPVV